MRSQIRRQGPLLGALHFKVELLVVLKAFAGIHAVSESTLSFESREGPPIIQNSEFGIQNSEFRNRSDTFICQSHTPLFDDVYNGVVCDDVYYICKYNLIMFINYVNAVFS